MKNTVIIGAGQLGSRHLQGLKTAKVDMSIFVVDPNIEALEIAEKRYYEVEDNPTIRSINFCSSITLLPKDLDLVIVATSSLIRAEITTALIQAKKIKNIVFEKFLFPSISTYSTILNLLDVNNVNAWVNCPRRMFSYFDQIKEIIENEEKVKFSVSGGQWGLACNSIHFIDIFSFLSATTHYSLDVSRLDTKIIESKRSGYIEFTGTIAGAFENQQQFEITSLEGESNPPVITINTTNYQILINESKSEMVVRKRGAVDQEIPIQIAYQSQLTGNLAEQILNTGKCKLTPFKESCDLHLTFLKPIVNFYNSLSGNEGDYCPIT